MDGQVISFQFIGTFEIEVPVIWREKGGKNSLPSKYLVEKSVFASQPILILEVGGRNLFCLHRRMTSDKAKPMALIGASVKTKINTIVNARLDVLHIISQSEQLLISECNMGGVRVVHTL